MHVAITVRYYHLDTYSMFQIFHKYILKVIFGVIIMFSIGVDGIGSADTSTSDSNPPSSYNNAYWYSQLIQLFTCS